MWLYRLCTAQGHPRVQVLVLFALPLVLVQGYTWRGSIFKSHKVITWTSCSPCPQWKTSVPEMRFEDIHCPYSRLSQLAWLFKVK